MKTLIAIPCMDNAPIAFMQSLIALRKTEETYHAESQNSLIYDSRNKFAAKAITNGYDRVLWLDSDMVFDPDLMERLGADMDENGLDYVAGLFFKRALPTAPCVYQKLVYEKNEDSTLKSEAHAYYDYPRGKLFEAAATGFGAVMTSVKMIRDIWEHFGPPFDPLPQLGEDLTFCYRAGQLGYKVYCDSRVKVGHMGMFCYDEDTYMSTRKQKT